MFRTNVRLLTVIILLIILSACGGQQEETQSSNIDSNKNNEQIKLSIGHSQTSDLETSHYHQFAMDFIEKVEERTEGKVEIDLHPNNELGNEREMIEAIQLGSLDGVITSVGPLGNFAPVVDVLNMPFLFRDYDHVYKTLDGEVGEVFNEALQEEGLKVLAWVDNGFAS